MKRALLRNLTHFTRNHLHISPPLYRKPNLTPPIPKQQPLIPISSKFRFFSSLSENEENGDVSSLQNPNPPAHAEERPTNAEERPKKSPEEVLAGVEDVSNKELKTQLEKYFAEPNDDALPDILQSILRRKLVGDHEETDSELLEELQIQPVDKVNDEDFESDFEELHETDEEFENLYDAMDVMKHRMAKDPFFNMDEKKWEAFYEQGIKDGILGDTKECEDILEDMLSWDKLLPDDMKKVVDEKFNEIAVMIENGEIEAQQGYNMFKEFEDKIVFEYAERMEAEGPPQFNESVVDTGKENDDPPGEGPILRWQSRVVFCPGGESWHPKNRKVKLSVTVKEWGLTKNQFRRLKEMVGKRYNPGKDELVITSERFEHREENRKDCLRTLYRLIEEARKADQLVQDARVSHVKNRLRSNPQFMEKLNAKIMRTRGRSSLSA